MSYLLIVRSNVVRGSEPYPFDLPLRTLDSELKTQARCALIDDCVQGSQIQTFFKVTLLGSSIPASDDAGTASLTERPRHFSFAFLLVQGPCAVGTNGDAETATAAEPFNHVGQIRFFFL